MLLLKKASKIIFIFLLLTNICYADKVKITKPGIGYFDNRYLKLDQTTTQTVSSGSPTFSAGLTISSGQSLTLGSSTLKYNSTTLDVHLTNDLNLEDAHPHLEFRDTTDNVAYMLHTESSWTYPSQWGQFAILKGTDTGTGFSADGNSGIFSYYNNNWYMPQGGLFVSDDNVSTKPPVTFTVAGINSKGKDAADFVCDGTADEVQIELALNSLPNAGGIVQLLEGQFYLSTPVDIPWKNNITIQGMGGDSTQVNMANSSNCNMFQANVDTNLCTIILQNYTANGNKANNPTGGYGYYDSAGTDEPDDTLISSVFFLQFQNDAIRIEKAYFFNLFGSIVETTNGIAVNIIDGEDGSIYGCKFINGNANDIIVNGADNIQIVHNRIIPYTGKNGISNTGARVNISDNTIVADASSGTATGIFQNGSSSIVSNNYIGGLVGLLTTGISIGASAVDTYGEGNLVVLGAGSTDFVDSGSNTQIQVDETWYGSQFNFNGALTIGDGGTTNYAKFDADGDLTFTGTADYLVGSNDYIWRYSADEDLGMYLNIASGRLELRNTLGVAEWYDSGGAIYQTGGLQIDADSAKLQLGADQDFDLYHDGTNAYIDSNTGDINYVSAGSDHIFDGSITTTNVIKSTPHSYSFPIVNPNAAATTSLIIPIDIPLANMTVTRIRVSCDADPTTEITGDLKYADAFIGLANAVVINDFDTTAGVRDDSTITSGAVASGKFVYLSFDVAPEAAIDAIHFKVDWDYD